MLQKHSESALILKITQKYRLNGKSSLSRDLNTGPADYKSAALPTKPLRRHSILTFDSKKDGDEIHFSLFVQSYSNITENTIIAISKR